jgi:hypothetical protein
MDAAQRSSADAQKRIADQKSILEKRGKRIKDFLIAHRQRGKRD